MGPARAKPLIVDTSVLYAAVDSKEPRHRSSARLLREWSGELVVSPFCAAEADYLITERLGVDTELKFLDDLGRGFMLAPIDGAAVLAATEICRRYRDLKLGLTDASTVLLSHRWSTRAIATLDRRHFHAVEPLQGGSFKLLPA